MRAKPDENTLEKKANGDWRVAYDIGDYVMVRQKGDTRVKRVFLATGPRIYAAAANQAGLQAAIAEHIRRLKGEVRVQYNSAGRLSVTALATPPSGRPTLNEVTG